MAINNINALVDLEGLNNLNNNDYVLKYYNAALANQGQRWTNEILLEYKHFNIANLIAFRYYIDDQPNKNEAIKKSNSDDPYSLIPSQYKTYINEKSYLILRQKNNQTPFSLSNILYRVCNPSNNVNNTYELEDFDVVSNNDINTILFSKKLWVIKNLYYQVINDIANDIEDKENYLRYFEDDYTEKDIKQTIEYNELELWIPLNYLFEYVCDGVNRSVIYGDHKNIVVYIEPSAIDNLENEAYKDPNNKYVIYVKTQRKYVKTCIYNFSFTKDDEKPNVFRSYILPFIDDNNYWWINNTPTPILSKAEKPTNLNIILAYLYKSGNSNEFKILSGLPEEISQKITIDYLSDRKVWIKRHNGQTFSIICKVPIINDVYNVLDDDKKEDIKKILENSTIILMTKLTKLLNNTDDDIKKEYKDGLITTLWTYCENKVYDVDTDNYNDYDYISIENDEHDNRIALDFGEITNFSNLINFKVNSLEQTPPDNYLNRHIIFNQILQNNKQEVTNNNVYAVLQNLNSDNYKNTDSIYQNNFNFSLRYVNNVVGTPGNLIEKVSHNSNNKYFKLPPQQSSPLVTKAYPAHPDLGYDYYNEYIPNYNVPIFDLSEVLIKDFNVINKQNIISFDSEGYGYYSYIGTSYDDSKSVLHIGTSNTNINLGEYSLINKQDKQKFKKHDSICIDFDCSYLNSNTFVEKDLNIGENIYFNKFNFEKKTILNNGVLIDTYSTQIIPKSNYIFLPENDNNIQHPYIINVDNMVSNLNSIINKIQTSDKNGDPNYLYINIMLKNNIYGIEYYYKYSDLIYIDNLIQYLGITDPIDSIISNTNKIIYKNGVAKFFISSNNLLSNLIDIKTSSDTGVSFDVSNDDIFIGNQLNIVIKKKGTSNTLIIDEIQSHKIKTIWKLPENI